MCAALTGKGVLSTTCWSWDSNGFSLKHQILGSAHFLFIE